ncbi:ADCY9 [Branchiostoma lanceolatum]|uniref:Adenylate cyclase type 9 n=1 Tax=Branchiostoma lanceolatum TaxID=7740 RepID=A0A8K0A067_BRALA|nr:ADCY9 [Branchiostoma lanceolatum]
MEGESCRYRPNSTPDSPDSVRITLGTPRHNRGSNYTVNGDGSSSRRGSRAGVRRRLLLFERASGSWWDPKFDSRHLEEELQRCQLPATRKRFRYALCYIATACLVWMIYFAAVGVMNQQANYQNWPAFVGGSVVFLVICIVLLGLTFTSLYERFFSYMSLLLTVALFSVSLAAVGFSEGRIISSVGAFMICVEILIMLYTVIPMPLYLSVVSGIMYSVGFQIIVGVTNQEIGQELSLLVQIITKILMHLCIHLVGIHIYIMTQVRKHSTFWKVGQSIMARRDLETEKQLKEKMIHSIMPPHVASSLMKGAEDEPETPKRMRSPRNKKKANVPPKESMFRTFNMHRMENVSILFADIVGFTQMSNNKSAEQLVSLLNDLFGRFDRLAEKTGCEKISTLGDCYYCVAGCPKARPDHAECCIEMGLGMIRAIKEFCAETDNDVNMRVGVHTGTVLCGIVGTKRFKFDVWSNDVTLANKMEQSGLPGRVHLSEATLEYLSDKYKTEEREVDKRYSGIPGMKTYLIVNLEQPPPPRPLSWRGKLIPMNSNLELDMSVLSDSCNSLLDSNKNDQTLSPEEGGEEKGEKKEDKKETSHKALCNQPSATSLPEPALMRPDSCNEDNLGLPLPSSRNGASLHGEDTMCVAATCHTEDEQIWLPLLDHRNFTQDSIHSLPGTGSYGNRLYPPGMGSGSRKSSLRTQMVTNRIEQQMMGKSPSQENGQPSSGISDQHFSSSQQSVASMVAERQRESSCALFIDQVITPLNQTLTQFHQIRERTDKNLIENIRSDPYMSDYFFKPPINMFSLSFLDPELEMRFRDHYTTEMEDEGNNPNTVQTCALPRFNMFLDVVVSFVVFTMISIGCFLLFHPPNVPWIVVFILTAILEVVTLVAYTREAFYTCYLSDCSQQMSQFFSWWVSRQLYGAILISLPVAAVYCNMVCKLQSGLQYYLMSVALLHYTNFTQLSSWMKTALVLIVGIILIILVNVNTDICVDGLNNLIPTIMANTTVPHSPTTVTDFFQYEIIIDVGLLIILIIFLNREFEVSNKLTYHGKIGADTDRKRSQIEKEQADWLLGNILPTHVADTLKVTQKYSQNHSSVAVIFATIVNFNDFYEESFEGGKECIRVLNEIFSDFDDLLEKEEYAMHIEKIKTIGSTFMAASGLSPESQKDRENPDKHLIVLMDFALDMQKVINKFNEDMLGFHFILRIGYNHGLLTAGVIGTTKLLYDIWGLTVNVASRMDSTGINGRIQVSEQSAKVMQKYYEFEPRHDVSVKGIGNMMTYLLVKKLGNIQY